MLKILYKSMTSWQKDKLSKYFELIHYDTLGLPTLPKYDAILVHINDSILKEKYDIIAGLITLPQEKWYDKFIKPDDKIIIDHCFDSYITELSYMENNNIFVLRSLNWVWINENNIYRERGYKNQLLPSDSTKFFLLLMNQKRYHRTKLLSNSVKYLNDSLYSYVAKGILLDNEQLNEIGTLQDDRGFYPTWYSTTHFSLVAETTVDKCRTPELCPPLDQRVFISEKSFKPFAFKHPFITYSTPNTLKYLQSAGFETFNHIINENYDNITNANDRLSALMIEVDNLYTEYKQGKKLFTDPLSQEKLKHNFNRFYNDALVDQMFIDEIVTPIMDFINA